MLKKKEYKTARSLCAVILAVIMTVTSVIFAPPVMATEGDTTEDDYQYAVTIEFGAMSFYYDYGTWDVGEMRYVADVSSAYPAADTENGFPGWYGFDGITNKISVTYKNNTGETGNQKIGITLFYEQFAATDLADVPGGQAVTGIEMSFFADSDFTLPQDGNFFAENGVKKELYASVSGNPTVSGGYFESGTFCPIGTLTIRIGEFGD